PAPIVPALQGAAPGPACLTNNGARLMRQTSCCFRGFHISGVFAKPRFAVAPRTMMECRLSSTNVCCVPFPGFEDRSLQGASIGKAQLPRQIPHTIHRV